MGRSFAEIEEGVWREEYKGKHIVRLLSLKNSGPSNEFGEKPLGWSIRAYFIL